MIQETNWLLNQILNCTRVDLINCQLLYLLLNRFFLISCLNSIILNLPPKLPDGIEEDIDPKLNGIPFITSGGRGVATPPLYDLIISIVWNQNLRGL